MPEMNDLLEQNKKQIEFLQKQCRKAGKAIIDQENTIAGLKKEIDRLDEENTNLRRMLGSTDDTE
jgi:chromosome segregation ATPase